jgi:hypothetical protein
MPLAPVTYRASPDPAHISEEPLIGYAATTVYAVESMETAIDAVSE